jgi:hypothetical protein
MTVAEGSDLTVISSEGRKYRARQTYASASGDVKAFCEFLFDASDSESSLENA